MDLAAPPFSVRRFPFANPGDPGDIIMASNAARDLITFDFLTIVGDSTEVVAFASANDFIVGAAVPEPSALLLTLTALAGVLRRSRSR